MDMDPHQRIKEMCPFCEQNVLEILWWPGHTAASVSRSAIAKATRWHKKDEGHVLLSEVCPNCGKSKREIEKAWKDGPPKNEQKLKKRFEEVMKLREEMKRERERNDSVSPKEGILE
jgi:ribosomal protein S27AE